MNLPSVSFLFKNTVNTLLRFAVPIFFAACATGIVIYLIQDYKLSEEQEALLGRLIMVCALGLPLSTAWKIMTESRAVGIIAKVVSLLFSLALLYVFYLSLGTGTDIRLELHGYRFAAWNLTFHLMVAFAAFTSYQHLNGFWQYNKHLFIRFLTAALYSGVLYVGLAGAILAVQELFGVNINGKRYAQLWVFIAGVFNTVFFFGGLPKNIHEFESQTDYPKGLKLFTQYVLIPLVSLYLVILYAYMAKIAIKMELPKGWVSNLILAFSVAGIFSLLLVHPIRNLEENKWIKLFSRFYYFSLLPMVALLFVAIGRRINDYGITIDRYIVATLGVWLLFVSLYFIFSKKKNIILIPVTLAFIFFFTSFGPWGAFKVSEKNQMKRLLALYEKSGVLQNGKIKKLSKEDAGKLPKKDVAQMYSIIDYLRDFHSLDALKPYIDDTACLNDIYTRDDYRGVRISGIENCTGIPYYYGNIVEAEGSYFNFNSHQSFRDSGITVTGYDLLREFSAYKGNDYKQTPDVQKDLQGLLKPNGLLFLYANGSKQYEFNLHSYCKQLTEYYELSKHDSLLDEHNSLPVEKMIYETETNDGRKLKLIVKNIVFEAEHNIININSIDGYLLIKSGE